MGHVTEFTYSADTLTQIKLPVEGGGQTYQFGYVSGKLRTVTGPPAGAVTRTTTVWINSSRVDSIADPDGGVVHFTHDGTTRRIASRTDRRGTVVSYTYDGNAAKVWRAHLDLGGDSIRLGFTPLGRRGLPQHGIHGYS